jgi:hypothetical protein
MSMSAVDLGKIAVNQASRTGYIHEGFRENPNLKSSIDPLLPALWLDWGGSGDCSGDSACGAAIVAVALLASSSVASSMLANNARVQANVFQEREKQAKVLSETAKGGEKAIAISSEKMFGIMATHQRVNAVGFAVLASGCTLLTAVIIGVITLHYAPNLFSSDYLKPALYAGCGLTTLGGAILGVNYLQKKAKERELHSLADKIASQITTMNSNIHEKPEAELP